MLLNTVHRFLASAMRTGFAGDVVAKALRAYVLFILMFAAIVPFLLFIGVAIGPTQQDDWFPWGTPGFDFQATYEACLNMQQGASPYTTHPVVENASDAVLSNTLNRYSYPPLQAILLYPLSFLPYDTAYVVWIVITCLCIVASLFLLSRLYPRAGPVFVILLLLYLTSSFLYFELERGQTDGPILLLLCLSLYLYRQHRMTTLTGVACALAFLLKVTPGVFLLIFLIRREWRVLAAFAVTCFVVVLATSLDYWLFWLRVVGPFFSRTVRVGLGVDHSLLYLMTGFFSSDAAASLAAHILYAFFWAIFLTLCFRSRRRDLLLFEAGILCILMNIGTPWSANYKLLLLPFAFLGVLTWAASQEAPESTTRRWNWYPFFAALTLVVPASGIYLIRLFTQVLPALIATPEIQLAQLQGLFTQTQHANLPVDDILSHRKAIIGLLGMLIWLLTAYASETLPLSALCRQYLSRLCAGIGKLFYAATVCAILAAVLIVSTAPYRGERRIRFADTADILRRCMPLDVKIAGLGERELAQNKEIYWGFGPKTVVAFRLPEANPMELHYRIASPFAAQEVTCLINGVVSRVDVLGPVSQSGEIDAVVRFDGQEGLNWVTFEYRWWNTAGIDLGPVESRPLAVWFYALTLSRQTP